uniref:Uncharacterized protein n=2 Tax=Cucumis melo TaxID=3656 RepID=A0A9I9CYZ8_CUCME
MNGARRWSSSKLLSSNRAAVEGTVSKLRPSKVLCRSGSRRRLSRAAVLSKVLVVERAAFRDEEEE